MTATIEVLEIRKVDTGNVRAFVKLRLGGLVIHGVKVVQQDGQKAWVALPQTKSGERWFPVVECTSKDLKQRITDVVLAAWQRQRQEVTPPSHARSRRDPRQSAVDEWAARFDERGPDPEAGF
jgi:DNA-binding cell septation regulator SpoVG